MNNISYITIIPKTQYTALYYLDASLEAHAKRLEDLKDFIFTLINRKKYYQIIDELIYTFIPFIIDIENQTISELGSDLEENFQQLKKDFKQMKPYIEKKKITKLEKFENLGSKSIFSMNFTNSNK